VTGSDVAHPLGPGPGRGGGASIGSQETCLRPGTVEPCQDEVKVHSARSGVLGRIPAAPAAVAATLAALALLAGCERHSDRVRADAGAPTAASRTSAPATAAAT
jgi:hypothetical protein